MDSRQFNIDLLIRKLRDAEELLDNLAFGDAMLTVSQVLVAAQERYFDEIAARARDLQQQILERLGTFKQDADRFRVLQDTVEVGLDQARYQEVARACQEIVRIAPDVRKEDVAKRYRDILEDCQAKLVGGTAPVEEVIEGAGGAMDNLSAQNTPNTQSASVIAITSNPATETVGGQTTPPVGVMPEVLKKLEKKTERLRRVEDIFQNEFVDAHYEACLDILALLITLSEELGNVDKVELYKHLRKVLKRHLSHEHLRVLLNPEMAQAIERQKQMAGALERNLKFPEARKIYEDVLRMAKNLKEEFTVALCEHKITQLTVWEEAMVASDLTKWTIPPFRVLFQARFDCLELLPDRASAEARKNSLVAQRVNPESVRIVTIIRARFKGQGPFDATGTCHAIYIRRAWDSGE